jgi:hypothetical protein
MESTRLARAGYWLAFVLIAFSIANWVASVWPVQIGQARWRFGAVGALSNAVLTPLLGLFLAFAIAVWRDDTRVRRALGWLSAILAGCSVILLLGFTLDFLQTRATADPRIHHTLDIASGISIVKQIGIIITLVFFSMTGIRRPSSASGQRPASPRTKRSKKEIVLLPGSNAPPPAS